MVIAIAIFAALLSLNAVLFICARRRNLAMRNASALWLGIYFSGKPVRTEGRNYIFTGLLR